MGCQCLLADIVQALASNPKGILNNRLTERVSSITTDSRTVQPGDLFVALKGDRFDGHTFVETALAQGAIAAVISNQTTTYADAPILQVPDTLSAYQTLGRWWRDRFPYPVIAITGSVGKTTTKEMIAAVLSTQGSVLKTQANFNNEIGVPKTLLELDPKHHRFAVVEMGMRAAGEIALLSQLARPDVAVITNVGTAHIGRLGSEAAIAQAKCELLAEMHDIGTAVLNADNDRLMTTAAKVWQGITLTYGLDGGDVRGTLVDANTLQVGSMTFELPLPGHHNAQNFLAALAVAKALDIDWAPLMRGLQVELPAGRARRHALPNDVVILDETYNAGLESMVAALRLLADLPGTRRIAVLGTMKELGERSPEFHHQVGVAVRELGIDHLLVLADPAEEAALIEGAAPVPAVAFANQASLNTHLLELIQPGDRLLFKGSRAVALDRVVTEVMQQLSLAATD
ncbi:MAG: UDP-N-acetylmuramoyl-tripeptide--D-alanyl-D-alanine ligase [Cyanobacteria bacterium J06638_20]